MANEPEPMANEPEAAANGAEAANEPDPMANEPEAAANEAEAAANDPDDKAIDILSFFFIKFKLEYILILIFNDFFVQRCYHIYKVSCGNSFH